MIKCLDIIDTDVGTAKFEGKHSTRHMNVSQADLNMIYKIDCAADKLWRERVELCASNGPVRREELSSELTIRLAKGIADDNSEQGEEAQLEALHLRSRHSRPYNKP